MLGTAMLLLVLGQLPDPASELRTAALDLASQPETDRPFYRYLSLYNIPQDRRADAIKVARFWLNTLSRRKRMSYPEEVSETLLRCDIREYAWNPKAWEDLTQKDPYFRLGNVNAEMYPATYERERYMRYVTQSSGAIMRLDYFVFATCVDPVYSTFLELPGTIGEVKKLFHLQEVEAKQIYLVTGGSVIRSRVTVHNRKLTRIPSILGYWYQSEDVKSNNPNDNKNVLENLFQIAADAGEYIFSLPNGLQAYYVSDAEGKQLNFPDPEIGTDSVTRFRSKLVVNSRSCVVCHAAGLTEVHDVVSNMLQEDESRINRRTISAFTKESQIELEEFYLGGLAKQIERDKQQYAEAVLAANGLDPTQNAVLFETLIYDYAEHYVDAKTAATELGVPEQELREKGQNILSNVLAASLGGEGIPRDAWEAIYPNVANSLRVLQGGEDR